MVKLAFMVLIETDSETGISFATTHAQSIVYDDVRRLLILRANAILFSPLGVAVYGSFIHIGNGESKPLN